MSCDGVVRVRVDVTNPGQFFAACGLLELGDRLWNGAQAWFDDEDASFVISPSSPPKDAQLAMQLCGAFSRCAIEHTIAPDQIARRQELSLLARKDLKANPDLEAEKKSLDKLWREAPLVLGGALELRLDWFADDQSGGSTFKTWAGQQSVIEIARSLQAALRAEEWDRLPPTDWLITPSSSDSTPFYFDSDVGNVGSDLDIGFSCDPLKIPLRIRPATEFLALVGLQRFRPSAPRDDVGHFQFCSWSAPLFPETAAAVVSGQIELFASQKFQFRLFYRTDYLKSFLPAQPT